MAPAPSLRARIERMRADGGADPFQDLSTGELLRLTAAAARAFAQVAQVERLAHGMTTEDKDGPGGGAFGLSGLERKTPAELQAYLCGSLDAFHANPGGNEV